MRDDIYKPLFRRRIDILIFGATGCVGRYTVMEAVHVLRFYNWGVAGRNKKKLKSLLEDVGIQTRRNLSKIPIVVANICEKRSLLSMARRCRVIVNCCGPYETLGERVIKACIEAKTHYVDLCVESHFMDLMQFRYHEEARKRKVYIVSACGLQSLPMEVGINYMKKNFDGTINHIEAYVEFWTANPFIIGAIGNKTIWTGFILGNSNMKKYRRKALPNLEPLSPYRGVLFESNFIDGFCVPSPTIDEDIVDRTQLYFYEEKRKRPIKFNSYFTFSSAVVAFALLIWYTVISILSQSAWTRKLLLKWPSMFSLGFIAPSGLNERNMDNTYFRITFRAEGWERTVKDPRYVFPEPLDKVVTGRITGQCPLYGVACVCLLVSATTILEENLKLPRSGGVFTPGAAFAKTNIEYELQKYDHGLSFECMN